MNRDPVVTSRIMAAVRNTGTRPEMSLRRELFGRGLRYRVQTKVVGRPDIVFPAIKVACFVDGDRWHGNGWKLRRMSSFEDEFAHRNGEFWRQKITKNMERDRQVTEALEADDWVVLRVWASEVERDLASVANKVESVVRSRRAGVSQ